jgi:hypothetical protein
MTALKHKKYVKSPSLKIVPVLVLFIAVSLFSVSSGWSGTASAAPAGLPAVNGSTKTAGSSLKYFAGTECGAVGVEVKTSIDLGCTNQGNPIIDMMFGIIRFLSDGVGLIVVASLIYAGIQYSSSRGDPNHTATALKRIRSTVTALIVYIFAYAILNYIIPNGFFKP